MQWRCVKPRRQCRQPRRLLPQHHRASAAMPTASGRICVYVYVRVCASQRDDEERRENARQNRVRPMCAKVVQATSYPSEAPCCSSLRMR